jgi:hypothetical protein
MISAKNSDFVISPIKMITEHPYRIWQNFADSQRWLIAYLTLPIYGLSLIGLMKLIKDMPKFLLVSAWFFGPLTALITTALLYRPRYLVFITPYLLLYVLYSLPKSTKSRLIILALLALAPLNFMYQAYKTPLTMPLIKADWDYVSGWASGNGVKEIAEYVQNRAEEGKQIVVGTEGTFGLLPHGIELYTSGTPGLTITGYYPIKEIPPLDLLSKVRYDNEVYFVLNNTQVSSVPDGLVEVASYKKADDSYIRLYRLTEVQ